MKANVIIPARAGSKGIKNKNIIDFCGKPLIAWSIEQALLSENVSEVFVSTDGEDIATVSEKYGAKVIWRPDELASDTASSEDALLHAQKEMDVANPREITVFLQATSPIRRKHDIDDAICEFRDGRLDSLFSATILEDYCIWKKEDNKYSSMSYDYKSRGRRQDRKPLFLENGSIYIYKPSVLYEYKNRLGGNIGIYEMPFSCSYEIDSYSDISICETFMKREILS